MPGKMAGMAGSCFLTCELVVVLHCTLNIAGIGDAGRRRYFVAKET